MYGYINQFSIPEPRPDFGEEFATVYQYASDSMGKCGDCKTDYKIGETVALLGSYPGAGNRQIICQSCYAKQ
jgi:hypothetical protein